MCTESLTHEATTEITYAVTECSLGALLIARTARGLSAVLFGDDADALAKEFKTRYPQAHSESGQNGFRDLVAKVIGFIDMPRERFDEPLDINGTAFQQRVWRALRDIPVGQTASYADIAERIGAPGAVRAVARACAANELAVVVPCHRVLRQDGTLSGYRWGVARKRALLEREAAA